MAKYEVQVLYNVLGEGDVDLWGINSAGDAVGTAATGAVGSNGNPVTHAFSYVKGKVTDLGTLGGESSTATDINDTGDIVGFSDTDLQEPDGSPVIQAFLYRNGQMTSLGTLGDGVDAPRRHLRAKVTALNHH